MNQIRATVLALALVGTGCGTGGSWSSEGFTQSTFGWKATYAAGQSSLLGADWRVDNWERGADGRYVEKTGSGFTMGSGEEDYLFDLKLAHVPDDAAIWIKTRSLSDADAKKSLEVLTDAYLHAGSSARPLVEMGYDAKAVTNRFETSVGSNRALVVSLDAHARGERSTELRRIDLIVLKFNYARLESTSDATPASGTAGPLPQGHSKISTALMMIGYVNTASRFDLSRGDLDKLVTRLSWSPLPSRPRGAAPGDEEEGDSRWTATGYEQRRFGWKLSYPPGKKAFVGADWRLQEGADTEGSGYKGRVDLSFENIHNNAFIWTDTTPLAADETTKDLDVLFENYVGRLSEVGFGGHAVISSREEITVGGYPAVSAIVEREPTPAEREGRVRTNATKLRLVVTKFDYVERPRQPGVPGERGVAFMVIGYANDSKRFADSIEEFARFVGRLSWPPPAPGLGGKPSAPTPGAPQKPPAKPVDPNQPTVET